MAQNSVRLNYGIPAIVKLLNQPNQWPLVKVQPLPRRVLSGGPEERSAVRIRGWICTGRAAVTERLQKERRVFLSRGMI